MAMETTIFIAFSTLTEKVHAWAVQKGWWDTPRNKGELIALMHSELSECLEYQRKKEQPAMSDHVPTLTGEAEELADVMIRIFDYCGAYDISIGEAIIAKMKYNETREHRHGKQF